MKPIQLPMPKLGLDVLSSELQAPKGTVRGARNVVLYDDGSFARAPGADLDEALDGAHSYWSNGATTLVAAGATLYEIINGEPIAIFAGLPLGDPVSYCAVNSDVYFTAPGVLGKLCSDGLVRRPGVADLIGYLPAVAPTVGSLPPGRYGVSYSLTNDLGEESPQSSPAWINLPAGGGILLSGLVQATDVVKVNVYCTPPDGRELYAALTTTYAASVTLSDAPLKRLATKRGLTPMPGGEVVRYHNGRLYVLQGGYVIVSEPFDYGLVDPAYGWMALGRRGTMLEPVEGGLFVSTSAEVLFYAGGGPEAFEVRTVSTHPALPWSGISIPGEALPAGREGTPTMPVAAWLSELGLSYGLPDGSVQEPQERRVRVASDGLVSASYGVIDGVSQLVFSVESMSVGLWGPVDRTE